MIKKVLSDSLISKKELLKDYINFLLVIALSFFVHYDAQELAQSIWFYTVLITYLSVFLNLLIHCNLLKSNFKLYLSVASELVVGSLFFAFFFYVQLIFINSAFGEVLLEKAAYLDIDKFVYFIPFVIYSNRGYLKPVPQDKLKVYKQNFGTVFLSVFKTQLLAIISLFIGHIYQYSPKIAFLITYTIFFFPFVKTYKLLTQKKGC